MKVRRFYQSVILNKPFIYRPITRKEYEGLYGYNQYAQETLVCKMAVVDPIDVDWDGIEAGIPTTLCDCILKVSGMGDAEYINTLIRAEIDRVTNTPNLWMDSVIQHVFPHCTDEYLSELTMDETITVYAKALYTYKFLEGEKIIIGLNKMEDIRQAQAKDAPPVPPPPLKPGRNIYRQGVM